MCNNHKIRECTNPVKNRYFTQCLGMVNKILSVELVKLKNHTRKQCYHIYRI